MPKLSVCIPTHDMYQKEFFLTRCLDSLWNQTLHDFEIIVSDNSDDDILKYGCEYYKTGIKYFKNPRKGMAQNTNEAIKAATGEIIKILYLDDYLAHNRALEEVWSRFKKGWLVTGCLHDDGSGELKHRHVPHYAPEITKGLNSIGSPSVLAFKNEDPLLFDENLTWLLDCDYYERLYKRYGPPTIIEDASVVIGTGDHQMTNVILNERKAWEHEYMTNKYTQ